VISQSWSRHKKDDY